MPQAPTQPQYARPAAIHLQCPYSAESPRRLARIRERHSPALPLPVHKASTRPATLRAPAANLPALPESQHYPPNRTASLRRRARSGKDSATSSCPVCAGTSQSLQEGSLAEWSVDRALAVPAAACTRPKRREKSIATRFAEGSLPVIPRRRGNVTLRRPHQRHDPPDHAPSQEQVQQKDRQQIALASRQRNDRRQKIHQRAEAKEREKEKVCQNHIYLPIA